MCSYKRRIALYLFGALILLGGCTGVTTSPVEQPQAETLKPNVMEKITNVRRLMRSGCENLMDVVAWDESVPVPPPKRAYLKMIRVISPQADSKELLKAAERKVVLAKDAWQALLDSTGGQAPAEYAGASNWKDSSEKITSLIPEMLSLIREANAPRAMATCGKTCGTFYGLNKSAGVVGISERLFGFRQLAKPLFGKITKGDLPAVQQVAPELRKVIDALPALPGAKGDALKRFSEAAQGFIAAAEQGNEKVLGTAYGKMMAALERAYDACL